MRIIDKEIQEIKNEISEMFDLLRSFISSCISFKSILNGLSVGVTMDRSFAID